MSSRIKISIIALISIFIISACEQVTPPPLSELDETSDNSPYEVIDIYNTNYTCYTRVLARGDIGSGIIDDDYTRIIGEIEDASLYASAADPSAADLHHYDLTANAVSDENREFSAISRVHSWGLVTRPVQTNTYIAESDITSSIYFKAVSSSASTSQINIDINVSVDFYMKCAWPDIYVNAQSYIDFDAGVTLLSDTKPDDGSRTLYHTRDSLAGIQGFSRIGFEDETSVSGSGFLFEGTAIHQSGDHVYYQHPSANPTMSFETTTGQSLKLGFIIQTSAEINFINDGSGDSRDVEALAELENLNFTITATDPDNPAAVITIEYIIPEEGSGGFVI